MATWALMTVMVAAVVALLAVPLLRRSSRDEQESSGTANGADPALRNRRREQAADLAKAFGHDNIVALLR